MAKPADAEWNRATPAPPAHDAGAAVDPLTGLPPRAPFLAALERQATAPLPGASVALILFDIDHLTALNRTFGLAFGDQVLRVVGRYLRRTVSSYPVTGRLSGGTFALTVHGKTEDELRRAACRLVRSLSTELLQLHARALVTVSAGAAIASSTGTSTADMLATAEQALREAKRRGRNQAVAAPVAAPSGGLPPGTSALPQPAAIARQLRDALDTQRLALAFQPVVARRTGAAAFHECLLRLPGAGGRWLTGADLLPVAEDAGLVRAIDRWVLDRVTSELIARPSQHFSLNVSALSLADQAWGNRLVERCQRHPGIAGRLIVEITETAASLDAAAVTATASLVRAAGVRVALDDFGAGYTSLAHLCDLPVDMIKIDGRFVQNAAVRPQRRLVLDALIRLAADLGCATVAEHVETECDAAGLAASGVTYLQGYYLGRPASRPLPVSPCAVLALRASGSAAASPPIDVADRLSPVAANR